jgi:hypothetical protein
MSATLHTPKELGDLFGQSPERILDLARRKGWPRRKFGNAIRFTDEDLDTIIRMSMRGRTPLNLPPTAEEIRKDPLKSWTPRSRSIHMAKAEKARTT